MRIASSPTLRIAAGLLLAVLLSVVGYQVFLQLNSHGPEALLQRADYMSWLNSWIEAEPLYRQAEQEFTQRHRLSKALYARVSQMPAHSESSTPIPSQIALLRKDLDLSEAKDPETRLRILTILGKLEVNYDSGMARQTWTELTVLANRQHHYLLAARAMGGVYQEREQLRSRCWRQGLYACSQVTNHWSVCGQTRTHQGEPQGQHNHNHFDSGGDA